jgi:hypothetical protein
LLEVAATHSILDQLLRDSRLYTESRAYKELLDFVARMPDFAPFNAMLLQVQKPGLTFAASARDWWERFERRPKHRARPLLILWPCGPVALVYDVQDTEGRDLPEGAWAFSARGAIDQRAMTWYLRLARARRIDCALFDAGDAEAGSIHPLPRRSDTEPRRYAMALNRNHGPAVQFTTLVHELGHLFLGHLGRDRGLRIPDRRNVVESLRELEAESVSYLVSQRQGVESSAARYISTYVSKHETIDVLDVYQVMRAAGQVEALLDLRSVFASDRAHTKSRRPAGER